MRKHAPKSHGQEGSAVQSQALEASAVPTQEGKEGQVHRVPRRIGREAPTKPEEWGCEERPPGPLATGLFSEPIHAVLGADR